ncbi:hypothetical protein MKW94_030655 [Papaver nudicaule]|uniref:non-specific serine/threonine protein kinase n=1 Tax=Papaver nudicaule TaxID=74823 RepID=A0AA41RR39_PAPNU|nr:hypothetical protein [Papaver nudicaule]
MKPYYLNLLFIFAILISCFALIYAKSLTRFETKFNLDPFKVDYYLNRDGLQPIPSSAGSRTLKGEAIQETIYIAHIDGSLYSVEPKSGDVRWVFSSGEPLWSSFQAFPNSSRLDGSTDSHLNLSYIDVGDNLVFVLKGPDGKVKHKLTDTADQLLSEVSYNPAILDQQVILGSKRTEVHILNAKSGRRVSVHRMKNEGNANHGSLVESNVVETGGQIFVTRIIYCFRSISNLGEINWELNYSEYRVGKHSQGLDDAVSRNSLPTGDGLGLELTRDVVVPFVLPSRAPFSGDLIYAKEQHLEALRGPNSVVQEHHFEALPTSPDPVAQEQHLEALPSPDPVVQEQHPSPDVQVPNEHKNPLYGNLWLTTILGSVGVVAILSLHRLSPMRFLRQVKLTTQSNDLKVAVAKKKKARRLGNNKNNNNFGKIKNIISQEEENANGLQFNKNDTELTNGGVVGRKIGRLFVSNIEIARGSNGTVVFEGNYEGRPVAVKRLVKAHHDVASKEIQNLIASDRHQNIVRWYGVEYDSDFVYLSLERCMCNLDDLIRACSASSLSSVTIKDQTENPTKEYNVQSDSLLAVDKDIELWKANGYPSPELLKMMRDVVSGLAHLHDLGIIHRDLKPQNILILKQRSLCAKLSDMGISKRLNGDMSSLGHRATGAGSSGWQAPEQLKDGRQTRAVDLFSLGCVLFYCITGGKHPFGDWFERDSNIANIAKNCVDLFMVEHIPEAVDLLSHLLDSDPEARPKALDVLHHPFFWNSEIRLAFLRDTSDRVELEDREVDSDLLKALEAVAPVALGGKWDEKMESEFISNIGRYRRYKFDSTRDLLRVIRNKLNHFRELPQDIQELLGPVPEGFDGYFASRFPKFLMEVYKVMYRYCREEECFLKYFKSNLV